MDNQIEEVRSENYYLRFGILATVLFVFGILLAKIYIEKGFLVSNKFFLAERFINPTNFSGDIFIASLIAFAIVSITLAGLFINKTFKRILPFAFAEVVIAGIAFMPVSFWDSGYVPITIQILGVFMYLSLFVTLPVIVIASILYRINNKYLKLEKIVFLVVLSILPLITGIYYLQINTCNLGANKNCIVLKEMQKMNVNACLKTTNSADQDACYFVMARLTNNRELCLKLDNNYNYDILRGCINDTEGNSVVNDKIFNKVEEILTCKNNEWMSYFNSNPDYNIVTKNLTCKTYENDLSTCFAKIDKNEVVSCLDNKFGEEAISNSRGRLGVDFVSWIKILQRTISD